MENKTVMFLLMSIWSVFIPTNSWWKWTCATTRLGSHLGFTRSPSEQADAIRSSRSHPVASHGSLTGLVHSTSNSLVEPKAFRLLPDACRWFRWFGRSINFSLFAKLTFRGEWVNVAKPSVSTMPAITSITRFTRVIDGNLELQRDSDVQTCAIEYCSTRQRCCSCWWCCCCCERWISFSWLASHNVNKPQDYYMGRIVGWRAWRLHYVWIVYVLIFSGWFSGLFERAFFFSTKNLVFFSAFCRRLTCIEIQGNKSFLNQHINIWPAPKPTEKCFLQTITCWLIRAMMSTQAFPCDDIDDDIDTHISCFETIDKLEIGWKSERDKKCHGNFDANVVCSQITNGIQSLNFRPMIPTKYPIAHRPECHTCFFGCHSVCFNYLLVNSPKQFFRFVFIGAMIRLVFLTFEISSERMFLIFNSVRCRRVDFVLKHRLRAAGNVALVN